MEYPNLFLDRLTARSVDTLYRDFPTDENSIVKMTMILL